MIFRLNVRQNLVRPLFLLMMIAAHWVNAQETELEVLQAEIVAAFPHDPNAFTQGLVASNGVLYEGTGRRGESSLRRVTLETGEVEKRHNLDSAYFGEGLTFLNDRFYQLTWQSNTGLVYDSNFTLVDSFLYSGEGWGLTNDGESLIMSDGSATLRFIDLQTYKVTKRIEVNFQGNAQPNINELEYINGEIWANVWYEDVLLRIDPETGVINSIVNLTGLYPERENRDDVLNGIAWDESTQRLFVTGKLWPNVFEIRIIE